MSENDKETKKDLQPVNVDELDNKLVSDVTLKELFQYIRDTDTERKLLEKKKEYEQALKQFEETKMASERVFQDIRGLTMVTTPFRIRSIEELERFFDTCRSVLTNSPSSELVMSMGIAEGGTGVRAVSVPAQVSKA